MDLKILGMPEILRFAWCRSRQRCRTWVVLGLTSNGIPALESHDALKRRINEAARYIDLDRVAVSPQCGFAIAAAGKPLSEAGETAKLRVVVELAEAVWTD
jgi:5-methyltetrahydropteroyltriglutamate--homocysteine methyltransferase